MKKPIIGITGEAQSGKDLLYKAFFAQHLYERMAFGDAIKSASLAHMLLMLSAVKYSPLVGGRTLTEQAAFAGELHYKYFGAFKEPHIRTELQQVGTDFIREQIDPGYWIYHALSEANALLEKDRTVCFCDVRYPIEAAALQGNKKFLENFYASWEAQRLPFNTTIRSALTHHATEQDHTLPNHPFGLLPAPEQALIVRVKNPNARESLTYTQSRHSSETSSRYIAVDCTIEYTDIPELRRKALEALSRYV